MCASAPGRDVPASGPTLTAGAVALMSQDMAVVAADYHAAMPNASGGAVLKLWRYQGEVELEYVGTHVGTSYHLDTSYEEEAKEPKPPIDRIDKNPQDMWFAPAKRGDQGKKRKRMDEGHGADVAQRSEHAYANVSHKDQYALFVPCTLAVLLAERAEIVEPGILDLWSAPRMGKRGALAKVLA
eukprot:EG_transcript_16668